MTKYHNFQENEVSGDTLLGIFIAIVFICFGIIAVVLAFADAIDKSCAPPSPQVQAERRVIVDSWGEPQIATINKEEGK